MTQQAVIDAAPAQPETIKDEAAYGAGGQTEEAGRAAQAGQAAQEAMVAEELLVEEVSIDGMCGVY
jgi:mycofactocin precursor